MSGTRARGAGRGCTRTLRGARPREAAGTSRSLSWIPPILIPFLVPVFPFPAAPARPLPARDALRPRPRCKMAAERQGGGGGGRGAGAEENKEHKDGKDNKENERPAGPQSGGLGDSLGLESILRSGGGTWQARPRGRRGDVAAARGSQGRGGQGRRGRGHGHPGAAGGAGLGL